MKKVLAIIGARPQFIKHYPLEMTAKDKLDLCTVHTGQHYDENMSAVFFDQLGMNKPAHQLSLGGGSHAEQTGKMLIEIERIALEEKPNAILVYGDTNSTLAGALVAAKLHIPLVHVEAGLRSYNKKMPEEINRIMTDHVSDLLLVPSGVAVENLEKEGLTSGVHVVGDIMKDLVLHCKMNNHLVKPDINEEYIYVTLHRPYNVDEPSRLLDILNQLNRLNRKIIFPVHPRTKNKLNDLGVDDSTHQQLNIIEPQPYFENLGFLDNAKALITDSGGMQKEAYWLNTQCITIRSETEWAETLEEGCNQLVFDDLELIDYQLLRGDLSWKADLYGKGNAGERIVNKILDLLR